jgi:hypothetical protein
MRGRLGLHQQKLHKQKAASGENNFVFSARVFG